jgi:glucose-1-phosphate adenylyltransferase
MGVYLFSADYLFHCLEADARDRDSEHDFGRSIMPRLVGDAHVHVALFRTRSGKPGYWRDVGTIDSYWRAHQELLESTPSLTADGVDWRVLGAAPAAGPAQLTATASVKSSTIGNRCWVAGSIEKSVLSTGCVVDRGSSIRESVLLPDVIVGRDCGLHRVIVDSGCRIPDNTVLDARHAGTGGAIHVSPGGIVLVTEDSLRCLTAQAERRTA